MSDILSQPWPWYLAGPLIGLFVPLLLWIGNKPFGVSSSLRHMCAATIPSRIEYLNYDWRKEVWNLLFVAGIVVGAFIASRFFANPDVVAVSAATRADLAELGLTDTKGLVPREVFNWGALATVQGLVLIVAGGFLVGFGTRYADGCTSGHGITGLASLRLSSLIAVVSFFAGGLLVTYVVLPILFRGGP